MCMVFGVANGVEIGESCQVARSGAQGVCQIINSCQPVIDDIRNNGQFPTQCGFRGRDQIVCCPVPVTTTTARPTPRPTRISQRSELIGLAKFLLKSFSDVTPSYFSTQ